MVETGTHHHTLRRNIMNGIANPERVQADLLRRRSSAASKHVNRKRQAKKGVGKGGRNAWKREV